MAKLAQARTLLVLCLLFEVFIFCTASGSAWLYICRRASLREMIPSCKDNGHGGASLPINKMKSSWFIKLKRKPLPPPSPTRNARIGVRQ
ncbi:hypothetical protein L6164_020560 [Bauhinia variegata]|uniref:Uncharacterized protein n=1 Tax=Bauhinia variegata TaxID=167791 RepID=A0ACB9MVH8_BAUVA|nr:hypothetical protein L6164_020560 [Bauhinia variegata]